MIFNCKIKVKNDETLIKVFNKIHEILDKTHNETFIEIAINQKTVFLSKNIIITKKIIFVLITVIQIIQLIIVNSHSIQIKHL